MAGDQENRRQIIVIRKYAIVYGCTCSNGPACVMDDLRPLLSDASQDDWGAAAKQTTSAVRRRSPPRKCLILIFVVSFDTRHGVSP